MKLGIRRRGDGVWERRRSSESGGRSSDGGGMAAAVAAAAAETVRIGIGTQQTQQKNKERDQEIGRASCRERVS